MSNVRHLKFRHDVVDVMEHDSFKIYSVETIDEGIEILTGVPVEKGNTLGELPEGSVNHGVEARLIALVEKRQAAAQKMKYESEAWVALNP